MTGVFRMTVITGMVVMPRPTGKWARDDRGFWREIYTDKIVLNADGSERSREPYTSACGIMAGDGAFDESGPTFRRREPEVGRRSWRNLWGLAR